MERFWLISKTTLKILFILLIVVFLLNKLYTMTQIRGWSSGSIIHHHTVTDKRQLEGLFDNAYWVAWDDSDITVPSSERINLYDKQWLPLKVGDTISIVTIPNNPIPYNREGIYASNGNFILDIVLIVLFMFWAKRIIKIFRLEYSELE